MRKDKRNYSNCISGNNHCAAHLSRSNNKFGSRREWSNWKNTDESKTNR